MTYKPLKPFVYPPDTSDIAEETGICRDVIGRELRARGIDTSPVKADRRARRGRGFWRCFD
jgi:uncharacterized protein YijF (DUF1287 family)